VDYALHRTRSWWHLEKWYADAITPDGDLLVVLLAVIRVAGITIGRVSADLSRADGSVVRGDAPASPVAGGPDWLHFGPARIEGDLLTWSTAGLSGELAVRPRAPAAAMRNPLFSVGRGALAWTVEVPDADVTGEVRWPGGSFPISGRGYRDRVWSDILPWRLPLRTLRWGRAVTASHATTWIDAETAAEPVRWRWNDGRESTDAPPPVGRDRVLMAAAVADIPGLRLGPLRGFSRVLSRDLHHTRWAAPTSLDGEAGWAVHEEVRWR
jgi:hypothetical protein